ncbi:zinc ribbon domain-containing protein [Cronobacter sakazakii]|nr:MULTISPECIES: zinc ribbon domain-containing protein [Cronobacter]EJH4501888.1 zinc ribbon domain-containing protein [Cronobacter sakazakii]EJV9474736.1 zinc ribbon domain-containing protein [Cronobacter sakazakii]ELY2773151.1 zinc ribbon domain-containing protein [Cronobacter sakazakii]ELY6202283.1 zinc ribbon domain-containing protein [Cronobacter malonaticus]ELY6256158.1 zinc ribbon domain-containing protein [Cronobacter malonaticus]
MKYLGWTVLLVGVLWAVVALNMDVSVETGYGARVNNIGLMAARQNHIIIGAFIALCGLLMAIFGNRKDDSGPLVKCPFCAELVKPEAVKCKHCGSDLSSCPAAEKEKGGSHYLIGSGQDAKLNRDAVRELALKYYNHMSRYSVGEILITHLPEINRIRAELPPSCAKNFEEALEAELSALKSS